MAKETIETWLGSIWTEKLSSGEMRICLPYGCRAGELAVGVLEGKARWHPKSKSWYFTAARRDEIYQDLTALQGRCGSAIAFTNHNLPAIASPVAPCTRFSSNAYPVIEDISLRPACV